MGQRHGPRDQELKETFNINDDFDSYINFITLDLILGLQIYKFIGINQLDRLSDIISKRNFNYNLYRDLLSDYQWQPPASTDENYISNFAYLLYIQIETKYQQVKETKHRIKTFNLWVYGQTTFLD